MFKLLTVESAFIIVGTQKGQTLSNKLDVPWEGGVYLGTDWRTGEAFVGTAQDIIRAGVIRRVEAHRRWDRDAAFAIRRVAWKGIPDKDDEEVAVKMLLMQPPEAQMVPQNREQRTQIRRVMLRHTEFLKFGVTDGCPGCQEATRRPRTKWSGLSIMSWRKDGSGGEIYGPRRVFLSMEEKGKLTEKGWVVKRARTLRLLTPH